VVRVFSTGGCMPRKYEKRRCFEIECDRCGKKFMQNRATQRFCCEECGKAYHKCNIADFRKLKEKLIQLTQENRELRETIRRIGGE
jgi:uncharacterized protein YjhX (UPF0386 family)